jgi:hypothetical protein
MHVELGVIILYRKGKLKLQIGLILVREMMLNSFSIQQQRTLNEPIKFLVVAVC